MQATWVRQPKSGKGQDKTGQATCKVYRYRKTKPAKKFLHDWEKGVDNSVEGEGGDLWQQ